MITEVSAVYGMLGSLFDRWQKSKDKKIEREELHRLLSIESRRNLALLDAINFECEQDDPAYLAVAAELETAVLEQCCIRKESEPGLFERLKTALNLADERESEPPQDQLMSLYVKITALQKICRLPLEGEALRSIRYRLRLENVKKFTVDLVKFLDEDKHKT